MLFELMQACSKGKKDMGNEENASRNERALKDLSEMRAKLAPRCKLKDLSFEFGKSAAISRNGTCYTVLHD